jgi:predicted RNA-binding Zn ribbon-like protein
VVTPETIKLLANRLSLHFANTVDYTADGEPIPETDALTEPDALDRWGRRLGIGAGHGDVEEARAFRAALYALLGAVADGETASPEALHAVYAEAVAAGRFVARDGAFALEWRADEPRRVLYAVAADAVALLADAELVARLHRCPGRNCGWLFLDTSGRRRWCSMSTCGSRVKMRRLYARRREADRRQ